MRKTLVTFVTGLLVSLTLGVVALVLALMAATPANAKAVQVEHPDREVMRHNYVTKVEHVRRDWYWVELRDGSAWMVTTCRQEDSRNCYWNARTRGNGVGHSFVNLRGHLHYVVRPGIRVSVTAHYRRGVTSYRVALHNPARATVSVNVRVQDIPNDPQLGAATHGFRVRGGATVREGYDVRPGHRVRVTYRSHGHVIRVVLPFHSSPIHK